MKSGDEMIMLINGHDLYEKKDLTCPIGYNEHIILNAVMEGKKICKDCYESGKALLHKICPNKGVGEVQVVKPVFMFHLTDGKTMAVVGEKITMEREHFVVWEEGKIHHIFRKDLVKYVVKQ